MFPQKMLRHSRTSLTISVFSNSRNTILVNSIIEFSKLSQILVDFSPDLQLTHEMIIDDWIESKERSSFLFISSMLRLRFLPVVSSLIFCRHLIKKSVCQRFIESSAEFISSVGEWHDLLITTMRQFFFCSAERALFLTTLNDSR